MRSSRDGRLEVGGPPQAGPVVPCPMLVGRTREVEVLGRALDAACAGRGSVVFVVGEAGVGKSRLVHEAMSAAEEKGARILRGRAVPGSSAAAYRPLTEALAPVAAKPDVMSADLEAWLPALAGIVPTHLPPRGVDVATEVTTPVRGEAVLRFLRSVCMPIGGLLVLEDLHWADPETVALVEHLSDHLARAPVLCVVTVRSEEDGAARDLVRRVAARRAAEVLHPARLNEAQVAAMVYSCTGGSDQKAVEQITALSDGVPFLVEELLVTPGLPTSFADGVAARLSDLADDERRVLVTAAAFGRHFDWRLLAAATGLAESAVIDALDRGLAAQLVAVEGDGFRFRHALTAEAVFQSVTPPRRERLAAVALRALDAAYPELPEELHEAAARLAERGGELERAGRLHLELGEGALARGALHTAVVALERARSLLPSGDASDVAGERLVDALVLSGRTDDALAIGDNLITRLPAARAATVHLRLAGAAVTAARWELASEHLAAASAQIETAQSDALTAELALRRAELAIDTNDTAGAEQAATQALELARADGIGQLECAALQLLGRCARRSSLEAAEAWFRLALDAAEVHGLAVWRLRALHEMGTLALLDRSDVDALLEAQALAESLGAMSTAAVLDIEIAAGYAGLDDLDAETHYGRRAVQRGTELGLDVIVAYGWLHVATPAMLAGDQEHVESASAAARAAMPGYPDIDGLLLGAEAIAALAANDTEHALELAARCTEALRGSETAPPAHFRAAWPLLLAIAQQPEATAALAELEQAGIGVNRGARGWLTMTRAVLAGRSDPGQAAARAVEADGQLTHMPLWRGLARRLAAEAAIADGWDLPDNWLAEAETRLRERGYPAAAAACQALRRGVPPTIPPAWSQFGVTRREADVLALVIDGCSNREIADRLYLSVRTVEKHVEALLRKTATRTRTQLARVTATT